jgi:hypothetical protein
MINTLQKILVGIYFFLWMQPLSAQFIVKNNSDQNVMRISNEGKMAIGTDLSTDAVQTLELRNGTLQIMANAGQGRVLMSDATGVGTWTIANGDLSGGYNALTVGSIQGKPVTMPASISTNSVLKWNGSAWSPGTDADTRPGAASTASGKELAWTGSAFETKSLIYLRGYISPQQTFQAGVYDVSGLAKKVKFTQSFSSDNGTHLNSAGEFIVPKTGYYFISSTVAVVEDPVAVTLAVFRSDDNGSTWQMDVNGNATPSREPTTAVMVTGIVHATAGTRLVLGLRNATTSDCKSAAYSGPSLEAQNILTIMELP